MTLSRDKGYVRSVTDVKGGGKGLLKYFEVVRKVNFVKLHLWLAYIHTH